jgi:uncharacterized repeat protein (TIGR03803 family)
MLSLAPSIAAGPYSGVVFDTHGALYGTVEGGDGASPTDDLAYRLTPPAQGQTNWTFTALHPSSGGGDHEIRSGLVIDSAGNLYGMTKQAALFELTPPTYSETTLYTFANGAAGVDQTKLTIQYLANGAPILYGVTRQGGQNNAGTMFKFDPATRTLTTLYTFTGGADGAAPFTPVVLDTNGVVYGTTLTGGNLTNCPAVNGFPPGCGTMFKLDPATGTLTTLYTFTGGADGWGGGIVALGANGALYGTTLLGGNSTNYPGAGGFPPGCGTVFEISSLLLSAVLPESRSVQVGGTATAFATIINTGTSAATNCSIAPVNSLPVNFSYQTTNPATNALTGSPNTPVNIAAGAAQSFVIALTPTAAIAPTYVAFNFSCANTTPAPIVTGLNTLLSSASTSPTPDIVALAGTLKNDGIVHVTGSPSTGVFVVASVNLGAGASITASANTGEASLPLTVAICQTNPQSGQCLQTPGPAATTTITANATPTFGIFVAASGTIPLDPANSRIFVQFTDSTNAVRGENQRGGGDSVTLKD